MHLAERPRGRTSGWAQPDPRADRTDAPPPATQIPATADAPIEPPQQSWLLPRGFIAYNPDFTGLTLFDWRGQATANIDSLPTVGQVYPAGNLPEGASSPPLAYFDYEKNAIRLYSDGAISTLAQPTHFVALTGAPRQPVLAYSTIEYADDGASTRSNLYVGSLQTLPGAEPALSVPDTEGYAIAPLVVRAHMGQPLNVWYTYEPQGIGGEIVFPPRSGLDYLDLSTGEHKQILDRNVAPSSMSIDLTWLAYTVGPASPLTIRELTSGQETTFPLLPDSDRGAGYALFAPDNRHVAWLEAGGSLAHDPPDFQVSLRVASTAGDLVAEIPGSTLTEVAGGGAVQVKPVAWLDEQTLIVQVGSLDKTTLLRVNYGSGEVDYLASGTFAGLVYP